MTKRINRKTAARAVAVFAACVVSALLLYAPTAFSGGESDELYPSLSGLRDIPVDRGYTEDARECIECHARRTPGIVESWKESRMAHAAVSCYDCHTVSKSSPMASQCEGIKGTDQYISPMVSSNRCSMCHPAEVEQFLESGHGRLASEPVVEEQDMLDLMYYYEGGIFDGNDEDAPSVSASRAAGCQMCHGGKVELGPDNKPVNQTWPGGVGHRYPDGSVGNCTVCHTRHMFSIEEARKPEACASCHLGPDHPNIEIYENSKHGQMFAAQGESWKWDSAPDTWEPGDYTAPTCAVCHMSGIGELRTTHNINERLKWNLWAKRSVIRSGERGNGEQAVEKMKKVCRNCHGDTHVTRQREVLDNAVALYNFYYDKSEEMLDDLRSRGLLKDDPWSDGFQELYYFLWHHTGRRARQGAAMNGPDYVHWHGYFQIFQVYKDMKAIYKYRVKHGRIEELSRVMSTAPD